MKTEIIYCDHCADIVWSSTRGRVKRHTDYSTLPFDCDSANRGESATICHDCVRLLERQNNDEGETDE